MRRILPPRRVLRKLLGLMEDVGTSVDDMGMNRSELHHSQWNAKGAAGTNMLYGIRRAIVDIERDDVDHALVNFYGNLAQGLSHDTFIGGEGTSLVPSDQFGRLITLPPNSAANSNILWRNSAG